MYVGCLPCDFLPENSLLVESSLSFGGGRRVSMDLGGLGTEKFVGTAFHTRLFFFSLMKWDESKCKAHSLQFLLR